MTANADMIHSTRKHSFWQAARDHPLLVITAALLLFAAALSANTFWGTTEQARVVVDIERLDVDREATSLSSLIRTPSLSIDVEREAMRSDQLIADALKEMRRGPTAILPLPTRLSLTPNQRDIDMSTFTETVLEKLNIKAGIQINKLEMSLSPDAIKPADNAANIVNAIAKSYVDLRNRERKLQKKQALLWADKKLASWQGTINTLKTKVVRTSQTDSSRLLSLFMDATRLAQAETLSKIQNATGQGGDQQPRYALDDLKYDHAMLGQDLEKLERISPQVNQAPDEDETKSSNLKNAKKELALFKEDLEGLVSSGLLDSPAAEIILRASSPVRSLIQWYIMVPLAAVLSIMTALGFAFFVSRWKVTRDQLKSLGSQSRSGTGVLSDPYWPMSTSQRREESPNP